MTNFFKKISKAIKRRKRLKATLAHNAKRFENTMRQIDREYQSGTDAIMAKFANELARIGDIECEEAKVATATADCEIDQIKEIANQKRADAKKDNERRIRQIKALYR